MHKVVLFYIYPWPYVHHYPKNVYYAYAKNYAYSFAYANASVLEIQWKKYITNMKGDKILPVG